MRQTPLNVSEGFRNSAMVCTDYRTRSVRPRCSACSCVRHPVVAKGPVYLQRFQERHALGCRRQYEASSIAMTWIPGHEEHVCSYFVHSALVIWYNRCELQRYRMGSSGAGWRSSSTALVCIRVEKSQRKQKPQRLIGELGSECSRCTLQVTQRLNGGLVPLHALGGVMH